MDEVVLDRLAARSMWRGECLVWTGHCVGGYGEISVNGKNVRVHRAAWIALHGPIPSETPFVLHRCDNPPCWLDEHLWLGTQADNVADRIAKGRPGGSGRPVPSLTHCLHGHEWTPESTYLNSRGVRECRICKRIHNQERRARLREVTV
jgi:hypothetical protein